jgi:uncharacterized glyoxalase superfamily protein PhnB
VARRDHVPHEVDETARLALAVYYPSPGAAARWLRDTFGFEPVSRVPAAGDESASWIEFRVGNCSLMLFKREAQVPPAAERAQVPWVFVDDLEAHYATARSGGATIVESIHRRGYRAYVAEDLAGHRWTFAQARPTM